MNEKKTIEEVCEHLEKIRLLIIDRLKNKISMKQCDFVKTFDKSMRCDVLFVLGTLCKRGEIERIDAQFEPILRLKE